MQAPETASRFHYVVLAAVAVATIAGLVGCFLAYREIGAASAVLADLGAELPRLTAWCISGRHLAFTMPLLLCAVALAVTRLGRRRPGVGLLIAGCMLAFAFVWPLSVHFAMDLPLRGIGR